MNQGTAEANEVVAVARLAAETERRPREPRGVVPATATQHPVVTFLVVARIDLCCCRVVVLPVLAPFPDIAMHVEQPPRVRIERLYITRLLRASFTSQVVGLFEGQLIAKSKFSRRSGSAGVFPLGLCRQTDVKATERAQTVSEIGTKLPAIVPRDLPHRSLMAGEPAWRFSGHREPEFLCNLRLEQPIAVCEDYFVNWSFVVVRGIGSPHAESPGGNPSQALCDRIRKSGASIESHGVFTVLWVIAQPRHLNLHIRPQAILIPPHGRRPLGFGHAFEPQRFQVGLDCHHPRRWYLKSSRLFRSHFARDRRFAAARRSPPPSSLRSSACSLLATCWLSLFLNQGTAEANVVEAVARLVADTVRRPRELRGVVPATATQHPEVTFSGPCRVHLQLRGELASPILAPLPHVAVHVVQTPCIGIVALHNCRFSFRLVAPSARVRWS